tara:strand:- start:139 stop:264 length:126 start_codon:yes stop_codon:yes gene_type:complete
MNGVDFDWGEWMAEECLYDPCFNGLPLLAIILFDSMTVGEA